MRHSSIRFVFHFSFSIRLTRVNTYVLTLDAPFVDSIHLPSLVLDSLDPLIDSILRFDFDSIRNFVFQSSFAIRFPFVDSLPLPFLVLHSFDTQFYIYVTCQFQRKTSRILVFCQCLISSRNTEETSVCFNVSAAGRKFLFHQWSLSLPHMDHASSFSLSIFHMNPRVTAHEPGRDNNNNIPHHHVWLSTTPSLSHCECRELLYEMATMATMVTMATMSIVDFFFSILSLLTPWILE